MNVGDYVERKKSGLIGYIKRISGTGLVATVNWIDGTEVKSSEDINISGLKPFDTNGMLFVIRDETCNNLYVGGNSEIAQAVYVLEDSGAYTRDTYIERWLNDKVFLVGHRELQPESMFRSEFVV